MLVLGSVVYGESIPPFNNIPGLFLNFNPGLILSLRNKNKKKYRYQFQASRVAKQPTLPRIWRALGSLMFDLGTGKWRPNGTGGFQVKKRDLGWGPLFTNSIGKFFGT